MYFEQPPIVSSGRLTPISDVGVTNSFLHADTYHLVERDFSQLQPYLYELRNDIHNQQGKYHLTLLQSF